MEETTPQKTVVCVGDSITYGDTGLGHRTEHPWPELLESMLHIHTVNCGHNGASSEDWPGMAEHDKALQAMTKADVLIMGLGLNDVYHSLITSPDQADEALQRVKSIVQELTAAAGHTIPVCLLSIPQLSEEEPVMCRFGIEGIRRMNPLLAALDTCYRTACPKLGWHYINHAAAINGRRDLHGDSIHPNQDGYNAIAAMIAPQLRDVLTSLS